MPVGTGDLRDVDDTVVSGWWKVELSLHVLLVKVTTIIFILSVVILAACDGDYGTGLQSSQGRNSPDLEAHHASLHHNHITSSMSLVVKNKSFDLNAMVGRFC